ncbi:hypothetical protein ONS95_000298 [Cadophora gregata]|uniref:uncharacterized protein n=1 Tax=Cadophora gregata TaxID=51156 RepID=UPI0026DD79F1|nr:uncharacterized protein ONS95_000298 [Cadophora gregata]KAK0128323.1 hypothetical protein ONS95_000298 [Cadophora gregata]
MSFIPGTLYVLKDDGEFEITRDGLGNSARSSPLKRQRAESIASSCTLGSSTPYSSEPDLQIIETAIVPKPVARSKPDVQIVDPPTANMEFSKTLEVPASKRPKCNTPNKSDSKSTEAPQYHPEPPTVFDIDGFEELKYGPGGIINVDDLEERFENEFYGEATQNQARAQPIAARNLPICFPLEELDSFDVRGVYLKKGKTVEFLNGSFLKIAKIIKNTYTEEVVLRGWLMKRCSHMKGLLPKKLNEVCFVLEVELDDPRPVMEQAMVQVGLEGLVKIRHVVSTNYPHPHLGFPRTGLPYDTKEDNMEYVKDYERLVVRWKCLTYYDNASEHARILKYPINIRKKLLLGLTEKECTPGCFMDPATLRHKWRGDTVIGGSGRMELPIVSPPVQRLSDHAYECHQCGEGFSRAERLLEHFQSTHEHQSRRHRSTPFQRQRNQSSIIEILDDDDDHTSPRRQRASQAQIEDIRVRLSSILSLDGDKANDNNKVHLVREDTRSVEVDLTSHKSSGRRDPPRPDRRRVQHGGRTHKNGSTYTYGDAFCGAGGTTRGAVSSALQVLWGLDVDKNASKTWKENFPNATHYEMWAHDLVANINANRHLFVDILHLSPPCQVFSPVHTRVGKNDQQNFDSLFACDALVHNSRPRIITLEQTFGILHPKFEAAFNSLIQIFTSYGYSVSYQIVQFQNYGLAQTRRRLIIIAACPGETLPEVPHYTHSKDTSPLKPLTSVRSVLNSIPAVCPNHDLEAAFVRGTNRPAWDASCAIPTITCNGGTRGHPDGKRGFTERELAALQSFPNHHVFHGASIKKQIGNAVPPLIAEILFKAIIKHLKKVDTAEQERRAEVID